MAAARIEFTKMTGAGNDFVLVDNRHDLLEIDWQELARSVCDRRFGVGADGLLVVEDSEIADFKMLYFNADGSCGGMCGNGGRCAAAYAMRERNVDRTTFEAIGYLYTARHSDNDVKLRMKNPTSVDLLRSLQLDQSSVPYSFVDTGAPHVVIFVDELPPPIVKMYRQEGIKNLGRTVRLHPQFSPAGTNVNVICFNPNDEMEMRTYERGVEEETLACGTGAVACSVVAALRKGTKPPVRVKTRGGEILTVNFIHEGDLISNVDLSGSARFVFAGNLMWRTGGKIHD